MPRARSLPRLLALALVGAALGLTLYSANARLLLHEKMPMPFGWGLAVVLSGSMEPALHVGDLLLVHETSDYDVGDVVVYAEGESLVVHRVITHDGQEVQTKGDANNTADKPVNADAVRGVVVGGVPGLGEVVRLAQTPVGTFALVAAIVAMEEVPFRRRRGEDAHRIDELRDEVERLRSEEQERGE